MHEKITEYLDWTKIIICALQIIGNPVTEFAAPNVRLHKYAGNLSLKLVRKNLLLSFRHSIPVNQKNKKSSLRSDSSTASTATGHLPSWNMI